MIRRTWIFHPLSVFIFSILALGLSLYLYISWYLQASQIFDDYVRQFNIDPTLFENPTSWTIIVEMSLLVGVILIGLFIIFVYYQKTIALYRLQRNFINSFTHELKTPIASLQLYLDTFSKYDLPRSSQLKYIEYMKKDTKRLTGHVNQILNIATLEAGKKKIKFQQMEIIPQIELFLETNKHLFEHVDIKVQNNLEIAACYPINPPLVEMMMMNLITNALKYNNSSPPRITITLSKTNSKLILEVKDNGIGMVKSDLKKVFRKFYQVGTSDNMSAKGSGLGLYLVTLIVRLHQAKIRAESQGLEKGSNFVISLPYKLVTDAKESSPA